MRDPLPPDARIERFLRGLVRRGRLVVVGSAALRGAIFAGLAWVVASIVVPRHASLVLLVALGAALLATLVAWTRSRVPIERADEDLGLADRLPTWVTSRSGADPFRAWLSTDLAGQVAALPKDRVRTLYRIRLRRLAYVIPLLIVLLLLQLFSPLAPPGAGGLMLGGGGQVGSGGGGAGKDEPGAGGKGEAKAKPPRDKGAESRPPAPESREESRPDSHPPLPLLPVGAKDEIVIPELIKDGPKRKHLAPLAELEVSPEGAAAPPPPQPTQRIPDPKLDPSRYRRAVEEALALRHVPEVERPFVRGYFEKLAERRK